MEKNNLLLVAIAVLFGALYFSYMYKTGQISPRYFQGEDQRSNWQNDQNWRQQQMPPVNPGWQNGPPQVPPPQKPPQQPEIQRDPRSYEEAVRISQQTGKNMLLFFSADWCANCRAMKTSTLQDPIVKQELKKFVYYKVDISKERSVSQKYRVRSIPAYHIVNPQGRSIKQGQGRVSSREFIRWISNNRNPLPLRQ